MTERKFTDEEVIKALECCSQPYCNNNNCPLNEHTINTKDCITKLSTNSLDLINRQRIKIEQLKQKYDLAVAEREANAKALIVKTAEVERLILHKNLIASENELHKMGASEAVLRQIAEAIKEFAEKLKEIKIKYALPMLGLQTKDEIERYVDDILLQMRDGIDNLVKEMTEGKQ